jgi:hypothetical protein
MGKGEFNVFINSQVSNQIEALKYEPDLTVSDASPLRML